MPITKSAKKAMRSSARKRVLNVRRKDAMKGAVKDVRKAALTKNAAVATEQLRAAYQAIDKAVKRGVIKKNTAARKKSRLVKLIKKNS